MTSQNEAVSIASAAYRLTTGGTLRRAHDWQSELYQRLARRQTDAGLLLLAPAGAGKTGAVVVPAMGLQRGGAPRRLFIVGPDGATLDDPLCRLAPYLKASALADGTPRTLCVDTSDDEQTRDNVCLTFHADGSEDAGVETHPLDADVDLALTTLTRFQSLFFGSGGVHALHPPGSAMDTEAVRRNLFLFDEAQPYDAEGFARFHRLVEFLYAEDADVIVASSTMPAAFAEELSFLDTLSAPDYPPRVVLTFQQTGNALRALETEALRQSAQTGPLCLVCETTTDAEALFSRLQTQTERPLFVYHSAQEAVRRRDTYAHLRGREQDGLDTVLVTNGAAVEAADLTFAAVLSTLCLPEGLIRRAGRCNRRGALPVGAMTVMGDALPTDGRALSQSQRDAYLSALRGCIAKPFAPGNWKAFI